MSFETVDAFFLRRWQEITDVIDYNPEWECPKVPLFATSPYTINRNQKVGVRTDKHMTSLDDAVDHPEAPIVMAGKVVKTMDDNGRRIIFVGTRLGLAIVYDNGGARAAYAKRLEATDLVPFWYITGSETDMARLIGGTFPAVDGKGVVVNYPNFGESLETTYRLLTNPDYMPDDN